MGKYSNPTPQRFSRLFVNARVSNYVYPKEKEKFVRKNHGTFEGL